MSQDKEHRHSDLRMIPLDRIEVLNPRERNSRVFEQIVGNIQSIGLKKPIIVTPRPGGNCSAIALSGRFIPGVRRENIAPEDVEKRAVHQRKMTLSMVKLDTKKRSAHGASRKVANDRADVGNSDS